VEPRHRRSLSAFRARFSTIKRAEGATLISKFEVRSSKFNVLAPIVALVAAVTVSGACRRAPTSADVTIGLTITPQAPVAGEPVDARISLHDVQQHAITGATVQLEAHMTHPGMAPVIESASDRGGGQYDASLSLTMAGDWVLFADVRTAGGQRVRKEIGRFTAR
jgi:hypothetical protein